MKDNIRMPFFKPARKARKRNPEYEELKLELERAREELIEADKELIGLAEARMLGENPGAMDGLENDFADRMTLALDKYEHAIRHLSHALGDLREHIIH